MQNEFIDLVGYVTEKIISFQLPTNKQVLCLLFYKVKKLKQSIRLSLDNTISEVQALWNDCEIPLRRKDHCIEQLAKLHNEWKKIMRHHSRRNSPAQIKKENLFISQLEIIFDISHRDEIKKLTLDTKTFLQSQHLPTRRGFFENNSTLDKEETEKIINVLDNSQVNENDNKGLINGENDIGVKEQDIQQLITRVNSLAHENEDSTFDKLTDPDFELAVPKKKIKLMTPMLASALDRTSTSDHNAAYIIAATAMSLGHNIDDISLSSSTIHRARIENRKNLAIELKKNLQFSSHLVVYFDGKILQDLVGHETVDRIAVSISGFGRSHLLGAPKIVNGTGVNQAKAVVEVLKTWNLLDRVKGLCFDTTNANTGRFNGAAVLIEKELQRELIYLPCRHHIQEILLKSVFEIDSTRNTGPNVALFNKFQKQWKLIDQSKYDTGMKEKKIVEMLGNDKDEIMSFITKQFQIDNQPRGDYRELLALAYIFLGGIPPRGVAFKVPGAMHHARFMAKGIYCLKIFMFKNQFKLNHDEEIHIRSTCIFIIKFYIKSWFTAPLAIQAPNNDLQLIKNIIAFEKINKQISETVRIKMIRHLWYCSEDLIALALFDDNVTSEVKKKMVIAMTNRDTVSEYSKRFIIDKNNCKELLSKDLSYFASKKSIKLFEQLCLTYDFINLDPDEWKNNINYKHAKTILSSLQVVNDIAERGISLVERMNQCLTQSEEQLQFILQVNQMHYKKFPKTDKKTLSSVDPSDKLWFL